MRGTVRPPPWPPPEPFDEHYCVNPDPRLTQRTIVGNVTPGDCVLLPVLCLGTRWSVGVRPGSDTASRVPGSSYANQTRLARPDAGRSCLLFGDTVDATLVASKESG